METLLKIEPTHRRLVCNLLFVSKMNTNMSYKRLE